MNTDISYCAFSGHRSLPPEAVPRLWELLLRNIGEQADSGRVGFLCGGALGFDTLAAQAVIRVRARRPELRLVLALPCPDQHRRWKEEDRRRFEAIRLAADKVICVSPEYRPGCMQKRNRFMVDHSGLLLCYLTQEKGGTAYTVGYALRSGIPVVNLAVDPAQ